MRNQQAGIGSHNEFVQPKEAEAPGFLFAQPGAPGDPGAGIGEYSGRGVLSVIGTGP